MADEEILLKDLRIYTLAVLRNANAEVLPFDWRVTAAEFADTLREYQRRAGDRFSFDLAMEATAELGKALDAFYDAVASGRIAPKQANEVIMRLARLLIPVNFTREPRFWHDPAVTIPPLPALAVAAELDRYQGDHLGFAKTHLTRAQNAYVATVRQATRLVRGA